MAADNRIFGRHVPNGAPMTACPHCLRHVPDLSAHLRDDGGGGTRCPALQRGTTQDARIGVPIDLRATIDYDVACCSICGSSDPHTSCDEFLGEWPTRGYPHHDEEDEDQ